MTEKKPNNLDSFFAYYRAFLLVANAICGFALAFLHIYDSERFTWQKIFTFVAILVMFNLADPKSKTIRIIAELAGHLSKFNMKKDGDGEA
jgi:hypothetical protein